MKSRFTRIAAAAMALTMCMPTAAFAANEGSFQTSFDVYSPVLTISVPTKLDVQVNPIVNTSATDVKKFTVASNSIDIMNASVDVEKDVAIPVVATIKASISSSAEDVITEYNTFTADATSAAKRIYLELSEAGTAATLGAAKDDSGAALTPAFDTDKKLDLSKYAVANAAQYGSVTNKAAITQYGSLLSMSIAGPTTSETTQGETFSKDASKVTAAVGSFAVTGVANTNADWKKTDVAVAVTYNVKASSPLTITTPAVGTAPAFNAASAADVAIVVPNVGEATVTAMALHNNHEGLYGDLVLAEDEYTVAYAPNATTNTQTDATITIPKDNGTLAALTGADYSGKKQDLVIALSDGRMVVTTLTATAAPAASNP